jgi:nicotinamidase-related amidase
VTAEPTNADGSESDRDRSAGDQDAAETTPALVVIDMQRIFGDPRSEWFAPRFAEASSAIASLVDVWGSPPIYTRFVAPAVPEGAWRAYYEQWPFALVSARHELYDIVSELDTTDRIVIDRTTFGKWGPELSEALNGTGELVLVGVSTDCCVLSTALAAADAGVHVRVVADACAGVSDEDHQRALDVMALYGPLIDITTVAEVLATVKPS